MYYEIELLPVGDSNGDAICIRSGNPQVGYTVHVVDGGYSEIGESVVAHLQTWYGTTQISSLTLSHADDDHARGLINIMRACPVRALRMNRPWLYVDEVIHHFHGNYTRNGLIARFMDMHPYLVELEDLALRKAIPLLDVFQGSQFGPFTVLAPSRARYVSLIPYLDKTPQSYIAASAYPELVRRAKDILGASLEYWGFETLEEYPPPTSASNEISVVQLARFGNFHALFTGDVGPHGLLEAARYADTIGLLRPPDLFQMPHQGSRRNVTPAVLNAWLGKPRAQGDPPVGAAACCVGANKKCHPRKTVTNALLRRGYTPKVARHASLCYSNVTRSGWVTAPSIPFHSNVVEDE